MNQREFRNILLLSLMAGLIAGCHTDPNVRKMKYLSSGDRYSAEGKFREAAIQYENALKADKNFGEAHFKLAETYVRMGAYPGAVSELSRAVALQPNNYQARLDLGNLLLAGGDTNAAEVHAKFVLQHQPRNPDLHALLSAIALKRGDPKQALAELQRAIQLAPSRAGFYDNLALIQMRDPTSGEQVEANLRKAVALDPRSVDAQLLLSAFLVSKNRLMDAEQASRDAVAIDPKSIAARKSLAGVYLKEGNQAKGEEVLRQASQNLSSDPVGVRLLADFYSTSGEYQKAATEFARLCAENPKSVDLKKAYLRALLQVKNYPLAQKVASQLLKQDPGTPETRALNGIVLLSAGKSAEAFSALQQGAKDFPKDAFIQYWLGVAALAQGDTSLAQNSFQSVIQLKPAALDAMGQLAALAMRSGDLVQLSTIANKAIAAAPDYADGYLWRGIAEARRDSTEKAASDLSTAIRLSPRAPQAYIELAKLQFQQHRAADGEALLEQVLQRNPGEIGAMRLLTSYDLYQKQPQKAIARLNQQIEKSPTNSALLDLLSEVLIQQGNLKLASATAEKAMQIDSADPDAVMLAVKTAIQMGQVPGAIATWQKWLKSHPNDANAIAILGMLEEANGNTQLAEADYRQSLQIQPQQPVASNNLAYLMLQNGEDVDVALSLAQTARQKMPNSPNTADTLAWAYYHKGTYQFARQLLEDGLRADPTSAAMEYHLGMVYSKLKDKGDAVTHLKKAVALGRGTATASEAGAALRNIG